MQRAVSHLAVGFQSIIYPQKKSIQGARLMLRVDAHSLAHLTTLRVKRLVASRHGPLDIDISRWDVIYLWSWLAHQQRC